MNLNYLNNYFVNKNFKYGYQNNGGSKSAQILMTGRKPCKVTKKINKASQKPKEIRKAAVKENEKRKKFEL